MPSGVCHSKGAQQLAPDARTIIHHRMGFYTAPNGVLLEPNLSRTFLTFSQSGC